MRRPVRPLWISTPITPVNFEGQKPSIQTVVITKVEASTWADALKTGEINVYEGIADGTEVNTVLDMIDNGADLQTVQYDRAGYGKIQFFCDVTPTQFVEVRQAIAMLLDRASFADTFCAGWVRGERPLLLPPCGSTMSPRMFWPTT